MPVRYDARDGVKATMLHGRTDPIKLEVRHEHEIVWHSSDLSYTHHIRRIANENLRFGYKRNHVESMVVVTDRSHGAPETGMGIPNADQGSPGKLLSYLGRVRDTRDPAVHQRPSIQNGLTEGNPVEFLEALLREAKVDCCIAIAGGSPYQAVWKVQPRRRCLGAPLNHHKRAIVRS